MGLLQVRAPIFFLAFGLVAFNRLPPHLLFSLSFVGPQAEEFGLNISPSNILFYFS
jgi:hypothetical protein